MRASHTSNLVCSDSLLPRRLTELDTIIACLFFNCMVILVYNQRQCSSDILPMQVFLLKVIHVLHRTRKRNFQLHFCCQTRRADCFRPQPSKEQGHGGTGADGWQQNLRVGLKMKSPAAHSHAHLNPRFCVRSRMSMRMTMIAPILFKPLLRGMYSRSVRDCW